MGGDLTWDMGPDAPVPDDYAAVEGPRRGPRFIGVPSEADVVSLLIYAEMLAGLWQRELDEAEGAPVDSYICQQVREIVARAEAAGRAEAMRILREGQK